VAAKESLSKETPPGAKTLGSWWRLVGPEKWGMARASTIPSIAGKRKTVGSANFRKICNTKEETAAVTAVEVSGRYRGKGSNGLHDANIVETRRRR
jgi:hypothetical protein